MIRCSEPNVVGQRVCIVRPAGQMCRVVLFPGRILTVEYTVSCEKHCESLRLVGSHAEGKPGKGCGVDHVLASRLLEAGFPHIVACPLWTSQTGMPGVMEPDLAGMVFHHGNRGM